MISLISSLSLKLYINSLVYDRNIFESSSKVFGNLQKSLGIFGNFREMFGNIWVTFGQVLENLRKSSEIFGKSSKTPSSVCLCNKKKHYMLARRYEFYVLMAKTISHLFAALTREILFLALEHKMHTSHHHVISSIYDTRCCIFCPVSIILPNQKVVRIKKIIN